METAIWESERLYLRLIEVMDASDLFELYGNEAVVLGNGEEAVLTNVDEMLDLIHGELRYMKENRRRFPLALERKSDGKAIGTITISIHSGGNGELGYFLNQQDWNQGYMSEALSLVAKICFHTLQLHRMEIQIDPHNHASEAIAKKLGFRYEGTRRKAMKLNDGCYHDLMIYALLWEEYEKGGNQSEKRTRTEV